MVETILGVLLVAVILCILLAIAYWGFIQIVKSIKKM